MDVDRHRRAYLEALQARDAVAARGAVDAAVASGVPVSAIYLEILQPALSAIGHGWAAGEIDVAHEHQATTVTMSIIGALGPQMRTAPKDGRLAVVSGSPEERHALGVQMVADFLEGDGWEVLNLGASTPAPALASLADAESRVRQGMVAGHFQDRQIRIRIFADDLGDQFRPVRKPDLDFRRISDDMIVGDDVAIRRDDDPGPRAGGIRRSFLRELPALSAERRRKQAHDGRFGGLGQLGNDRLHLLEKPQAIGRIRRQAGRFGSLDRRKHESCCCKFQEDDEHAETGPHEPSVPQVVSKTYKAE